MMSVPKDHRHERVTVSIEDLVPANHFLRAADEIIDFSFIEKFASPYYCHDNGRPSIPPVTLFKMLFIGYFYGVRSERQLEKEIQANIPYRWFLGYSLTDSVPDHSTISFNRKKRFEGTDLFENLFDEVVRQAQHHRLIDGRILLTDSTHIKANANKNKYVKKVKKEKVVSYLNELEEAVQQDREAHGKKP